MIGDLGRALHDVANHTTLTLGMLRIVAQQLMACMMLPEGTSLPQAAVEALVIKYALVQTG